MIHITKNKKGFALLYIMLILASVVTVSALVAGQMAIFSGNRIKLTTTGADVRMLAMYCGENLLMQVRNNILIVSSGTLTYNGGTCSYTITGTSPVKIITFTASENNLYKKITITTSQLSPVITGSWLESS